LGGNNKIIKKSSFLLHLPYLDLVTSSPLKGPFSPCGLNKNVAQASSTFLGTKGFKDETLG
jgi:hypothetical protein